MKLVGTDYEKIVSEVSTLLTDTASYDRTSRAVNPYGDGKACGRIESFVQNFLYALYLLTKVRYNSYFKIM